MTSLIKKIDEIIESRSLLKHPFYQSWSDGKLTKESLAGYSKEYFQVVKAVPKFMDPIMDVAPESSLEELRFNRQEEHTHIQLWVKFANALGISSDEIENYQGLEKTNQAVSNLYTLMNSLESGASAMYSFEKEIPKISHTKLDGLEEFYGITSDDATEYFVEHTEADIRHAASWQHLIESSASSEQVILDSAKKSMDAQNLLLDSCFEAYC